MSIRDIKIERTERTKLLEPVRTFEPAIIISVDGAVEVPDRVNYVWVTEFSQPQSAFQILNKRVKAAAGLPVKIGYPEKPPFERQIVDVWDGVGDMIGYDPDDGSGLPLHAQSHQYPSEINPGYDPVLIFQPAMQMLKCTASTGLTVVVQALVYWSGDVWKSFPGAYLDLTSYVPGTASQSRYVLVYLNTDTNSLGVESGTAVTSPSTPARPDLPDAAEPSAYVLLANGQTVVDTAADITDARGFLTVSRDGVGYPFNVYTVDPIDPDADFSDIDSAIAVAGGGDVIHLGIGTFPTTGLALPAGVAVIGHGKYLTTIYSTGTLGIGMGNSCYLHNLSVVNAAAGTSGNTALLVSGTNCYVENVRAVATAAAFTSFVPVASIAVEVTGGDCRFVNVQASATGADNSYGMYIDITNPFSLYVVSGVYSGETADIHDQATSQATAVVLESPELSSDALVVDKELSTGYYMAGRGDRRPFGWLSPEIRSQTSKQFLYREGFSDPLDARAGFVYLLYREVTHADAGWYELYLDGASERLAIEVDSTWTFDVLIVGQGAGATLSFSFRIEGAIRNAGGTTTLLASTVTTIYDTDDVSFDARVSADNTNDALLIEVTDADGNEDTIHWVANVRTSEVIFS